MLSQITIKNFAIIDFLEINFKEGLTVLTGETGAGKSIIADALDFLLGARTTSDLIRSSADKAQVEGTFLVPEKFFLEKFEPWFKKNSFDNNSENVINVSRELTANGSKARINGSLSNVSHLLYLKEILVDIHEQSEHIELLKIEKQMDILDNCGNDLHKKILEEYGKTYEEYISLKNRLNTYLENRAVFAKKIDFLKYQVNEIKEAKINDLNEENELHAKREMILNKKELTENSTQVYELINGDDGVGTLRATSLLAMLTEVKKLISKSAEHDGSFNTYLKTIEIITSELKELSSFVNHYGENIDAGNNDLDEIEERLDLFYNLKKKYGKSLEEVQEYLLKIESELSDEEKNNCSQEELEGKYKQIEKDINALADKLTRSREEITKSFVNRVHEELLSLGFNGAGVFHETPLLVIEFTPCDISLNGKEQIQFLFTSNPDEPPKPLLKVASGGELSRIMLAIKSIACRGGQTSPGTMVFDEIDMGVSGEIAANVARKLYKISRNNQVLCITHQPIICAMADEHFVIEKKITDGLTSVTIKEVLNNEKAEALATLLTPERKSKDNITVDAKQFAQSLIENAKKAKEKGPLCQMKLT